jgi:hypothetical protein
MAVVNMVKSKVIDLGITLEVVMMAREHTYVQGGIKERSGVVRKQTDVPHITLPSKVQCL